MVIFLKKQGFIKGSAILMGMVIITKAIGIIYKLFLTQMLGGTGMGYYSSALAVFTPIMAIIVSGIPSTVARSVSENYAFERYKNVRKIKLTAFITFGLASVITCALFILLSSFCADNIIGEQQSKSALIAISPSVIAAAILSVERGYYEGLKNMIPTAVSEIIETITKLILSLGFAYGVTIYAQNQFQSSGKCFGVPCSSYQEAIEIALPYITAAAVLGVSLSTCIACIYIIISGKIHGDGISSTMLCRDRYTDRFMTTAKKLKTSAFPIAIASVIATLSNMIDLMTINTSIKKVIAENSTLFSNLSISEEMIPNFIYGSYSALPLTIFGFVPTITAMFGKSILPSLSESWVKKEKSMIETRLNLMMFITTIIAVPSGIGISVMSKEILELLFSGREEEISVSVIPLCILGCAVIFQSIMLPCFSVLQTIGKSDLPIIISLVGGGLKLIGNMILIPIPSININGAAISAVISNGIMCIWSVIAMIRISGIKLNIRAIFVKTICAGILCGCTARLTYDLLAYRFLTGINEKIITLFTICFTVVMYIFYLYLLCVSPKKQIFSVIFKKK